MAYADVQDRDPKEIDQGFIELDNHLSKVVSLEENNKIFSIVCKLCDAYEKRAFRKDIGTTPGVYRSQHRAKWN